MFLENAMVPCHSELLEGAVKIDMFNSSFHGPWSWFLEQDMGRILSENSHLPS